MRHPRHRNVAQEIFRELFGREPQYEPLKGDGGCFIYYAFAGSDGNLVTFPLN